MSSPPLPSTQDVVSALEDVYDPCSVATGMPLSLPAMGLIKDVEVSEAGAVSVTVRLSSPGCYMLGFFTDEIVKRVRTLPGVDSASVSFDTGFEWDPSFIRAEEAERRRTHFRALELVAVNQARTAP